MTLDDIEPGRLYALRDVCSLVPSVMGRNCRLSLATVHRWRREGKLPCVRLVGRFYVEGRALLALVERPAAQPPAPRTPGERARVAGRAMQALRGLGVKV